MAPLVKICGTTSPADARLTAEVGADFFGVILHPPSPRFLKPTAIEPVRAAAQDTPLVLVTVNLTRETLLEYWVNFQPRALQLHGDESPALVRELTAEGCAVWKVLSGTGNPLYHDAETYTQSGAEALIVDAREETDHGVIYGGTGKVADWNAARHLVEDGYRVMLAGGLTIENVSRAIQVVQPWAVDVASGVEARKGVKNPDKVRQFVQAARVGISVPAR